MTVFASQMKTHKGNTSVSDILETKDISLMLCLEMQLSLAKKYHLPLFLHSRAAHADFTQILREEGFGADGGLANGGKSGVVHSFTGTEEEVKELVCQ